VAGGIEELFARLLQAWPEHERYLGRLTEALSPQERRLADTLADWIALVAGSDLDQVCEDYRWLCREMQDEQLHFARNGAYRLSTFSEAYERVYGNAEYMRRYLNGLLVGRITWIEQLRMLAFYADEFLPSLPDSYDHLEIGPGHGVLLYLACNNPRCATLSAIDVSESSLDLTAECLRRLGARAEPRLICSDVLEGALEPGRRWHGIVLSEVLEHLEAPSLALDHVVESLEPGGRAFITTPANCPMPDHIFLFRSPEEIIECIEAAGLRVLEQRCFTGVGIDEARARKRHLPIACAVIAERSARM
jgi:2-polyprenyl-3-methyl-5-hydroxy-6-metoxy-1,4-benzoquinol methylase